MCRFVSRAVWYGFSIRSRFRSEADVLCCWDRWNFWREISCGGWFLWTGVSQRCFGAMEKGESALVTKMSTCYWRDGGGTGVCYAICTWNQTRSLRNPGTATSTATASSSKGVSSSMCWTLKSGPCPLRASGCSGGSKWVVCNEMVDSGLGSLGNSQSSKKKQHWSVMNVP